MMAETAEEISRRPEIRKELQRATGEKRSEKVKVGGSDKFWFLIHALVLAGCVVAFFLLGSKLIPLPQSILGVVARIVRGTLLTVIVLAIARAVSVYALGRIEDPAVRFTLQRVMHLIVALAIAVIAVSIIFVNWYTALAALGIGSIIIGLAVQTPMKSFIALIYILIRQPFRVGDRIQIGDATGDVIDVGYLDTTLWEFGGKYISGDHPSGRLIKFPNEKVLDEIVYNYSWPLFPYIWNEIKFYVAFNADLEFIASTMQKITEEELGKEMIARVQTFRDLLARTPVDELEVHERPRVIFRVNENTWLEAIVRFGWADAVIIFVWLRQLLFALEEKVKAFALTQLKILVHLDCFKWTDLDANLAAHADRNIDVEHLRVKLRFAHVIGLFVVAFDDVDALGRTFLLANLARHAAQSRVRVVAVVKQERKIAIVLRKRIALFGILHRDQPLLVEITSDEISCGNRHALKYARANHRSTSPITISTLPRITITSATVWPRHRSSSTVRLMKLGGRTR